MSDKVFVGLDLTGMEDNGLQRPISRVTLLLDDESAVTAGDDTGLELTAPCPYATQVMANAILAQVKGYQYRMFSAEGAAIDPAAELGDGVTAGIVYSELSRISDDGSGYAGLSAPGEAELEEDYPSGGPMTQAFNRKIAKTRSQILKTAESITLKVENEIAGLSGKLELTDSRLTAEITNTRDGLNSKIEQTASSLTSKITATDGRVSTLSQTVDGISTRVTATDGRVSTLSQTVNGISTKVSNAEGDISKLEQFADGLTLSVSNGSTSSVIALKSGSTTIKSQTINMTGLVTYTGLENGTTVINGGCVQTGTIDAERLNLTGAITFGDLSKSLRNDINDAYAMAEDAQSLANDLDVTVGGWLYRGTTYIDGGMIMTGTVMASRLLGGTVGLLDANERVVGGMNITRTQTGDGLELYTDYGGIRISAAGNWWVDAAYGSLGITDSGVICKADCVPEASGRYDLGGPGLNWSDVYADNDTIITSDRRKKRGINYDLTAYDRFFDSLRPASYRLKDGRSGRTHLGLIAQDVEEAMKKCDLTDKDFAGLVKAQREDGGFDYALRYGEFIALCIQKIQMLNARVAELERKIAL